MKLKPPTLTIKSWSRKANPTHSLIANTLSAKLSETKNIKASTVFFEYSEWMSNE